MLGISSVNKAPQLSPLRRTGWVEMTIVYSGICKSGHQLATKNGHQISGHRVGVLKG